MRVISRKYSNTKNSTIFNSMIETFDDEELLEKRVKLFSTFSKESTLVDTGILSKNGSVISATVGGVRHRSKLNSDDPEFLPSITELPIGLAGSGKPKVMQWSCP